MFSFLLAWYNLPFLAGLICSLALSLLQLIGGFGNEDADADADADVDADVDIDADLDADVDADVDIDTDVDADVDIDTDLDTHAPVVETAGGGFFNTALAALGVGRVPLLLVLMVFLGCFGAVGLLANTLLTNVLGNYPAPAFFLVLLAGIIAALPLTGRISRLLGRMAPASSTAIGFEQLVGRVGTVVSPSVSPTYGRVQVKDTHGTLHTVYAVVADGASLPERSEVALLAYDAPRRCFVVGPLDQLRRRPRAGRDKMAR
jgi:hypothetical protein